MPASESGGSRRDWGSRAMVRIARFMLAVCFLTLLDASSVHAACNLIPQTENSFDSALGVSTRPFAAPGEPIELRVRPCDTAPTGTSPGISPTPTAQNITVLFKPTGNGTKHAVVLTAASDCTALTAQLAACDLLLGAPGGTQGVPATGGGVP